MTGYILGIHNGVESGLCLMKDGRILEAVSEERHNRIKVFAGLPEASYAYVKKKYSIVEEDIESVVYSRVSLNIDYPQYLEKFVKRSIEAVENNSDVAGLIIKRMSSELSDLRYLKEFKDWITSLGVQEDRIILLEHHAAHAWSAFSCSPFDDALVLTSDGRGDLKSTTLSIASKDEGLREIDFLLTLDSLAFLYGQVTAYLGFTPHRHEGKVTGLAAFGDPSVTLPFFESIVDWDDEKGCWQTDLSIYSPTNRNNNPAFSAALSGYSKEDIAAGVQAHCEFLITSYVKHWLKKLGPSAPKDICLAGGIFANVKINQCVNEIAGINNIFVFPCMGDGGLPVGSACYQNFTQHGVSKVDFQTVYLGSEYSKSEIQSALDKYSDNVECMLLNDRPNDIARMLDEGLILGYFDGRMEFGPRALGARSILANARDKSINDTLNKRLQRTEFMPFAPVTPIDFASECYIGWQRDQVSAGFMTRTYACTAEFTAAHPAVVHVDGTARPQVVSRSQNPRYYEVLRSYARLTGEKALINTSFNAHEEPIIRTPTEAIESLMDCRVDALILGDFLVTNK